MSEYPAPLHSDPYQGMPKLECPATELNRSRRGETLNAVLQNPESTSWKSDGPKRAAVDRAVLSVREKSSFALRECMYELQLRAADRPALNWESDERGR